ncbi:hypothetical protein BJ170DRAFT_28854 [Xylariales sp. AK1849]|nr:hypothetical protein BJ170DRAFT_28854 [Xylariales sp. AK1849]
MPHTAFLASAPRGTERLLALEIAMFAIMLLDLTMCRTTMYGTTLAQEYCEPRLQTGGAIFSSDRRRLCFTLCSRFEMTAAFEVQQTAESTTGVLREKGVPQLGTGVSRGGLY